MVKIAGEPNLIRDPMARLPRIQETRKMSEDDANLVLRTALELNWQFIQSKRKLKTNFMMRGTLLNRVAAMVETLSLDET